MIFDDLYGYETNIENSELVRHSRKCSQNQNKILELYKNITPENMNLLMSEVNKYKTCLKNSNL